MTLTTGNGQVDVSVLVPAKDEAENLGEFVRQCAEALRDVPYACEVVIVDDGSEDDTAAVLQRLGQQYGFLRVVRHRSQRGIADALRSAADIAAGRVFVFYPADLQYLPAEIPRLVEPIRDREADIVTGTKQGTYEKAFVSRIYNRLSRWLFGVRATDLNAVKAYRREVMEVIPAPPRLAPFHGRDRRRRGIRCRGATGIAASPASRAVEVRLRPDSSWGTRPAVGLVSASVR